MTSISGGGALSPQPLIDGRRLDDLVGPRFAVITAEPLPTADPDREWWSSRATFLDATTHPVLSPLLADAPAEPPVDDRPGGPDQERVQGAAGIDRPEEARVEREGRPLGERVVPRGGEPLVGIVPGDPDP